MKRMLRTLLVLLVGFVGGAIAMGLLHSYVRPIDRDVMRANFVAQQRFAATHAARAGDALGAIVGFANVVEASSMPVFRPDRPNWDGSDNVLFPFSLLILRSIKREAMGRDPERRGWQISEAHDRARLALALEALHQDVAASVQWEQAAQLGRRSKEAMRRAAEMQANLEASESWQQAEAAILDPINESQASE